MPWSDPEHRRAYHRKYYENNKGKWIESRKRQTASQKRNAAKYMRNYSLLREYSITSADYKRMLKKQRGVCAICKKKHKGWRNLHVDHCHKTGAVRMLLCGRCNMALGVYETHRRSFERYLRKFK